MKERPILFTGDMVRAILEGRKTQTRRVVKLDDGHSIFPTVGGGGWWTVRTQAVSHFPVTPRDIKCPYGVPGDTLWVKETWRPAWHEELYCSIQYAADSSYRKPEIADEDRGHRFADMCERSGDHAEPWHPSIHMWREFSRLTLLVKSVRVERLQEISEADAEAEGCEPALPVADRRWVCGYRRLWESINGAGSWANNPWVWVIGFKQSKETR